MLKFDQLTFAEQRTRLIELASSAIKHWGFEGVLRLIKHRENAVYKLTTSTGEHFALRIHRKGYHSDQSLKSELQWMEALKDFGIALPTVIPDRDGRSFARVSTTGIPDGRQVDLLAWVDGQHIGSGSNGLGNNPSNICRTYKSVGRLMARMHNHATQWELPQGFKRHAWDVEGLVGENPLWGRFWELSDLTKRQQGLVLEAREAVCEQLLIIGKSKDHYSLIHADFVPENILIHGDRIHVIDFDDTGFGWHLFDLATALYFIQDNSVYDSVGPALIDGYRELRTLPDSMVEQLPLFLVARSFTYLGWLHSRQDTGNAKRSTSRLIDMGCRSCEQLLK